MVKVSSNKSNKKHRTSKGSNKLSKKKGRSKVMKKAKQGISMKKMMHSENKPRQVYCLKCKDKVEITDYKITKNKRGIYQVQGLCRSNLCAQKPMKVFAYISADELKKTK